MAGVRGLVRAGLAGESDVQYKEERIKRMDPRFACE